MADDNDVNLFLHSAVPHVVADVDATTKDALSGLLDSYVTAGYSADDLAAVLGQKASVTSLAEVSLDRLAGAVAELHRDVQATVEHADTTGASEPTEERMLADLAAALGQDAAELIRNAENDFMASVFAAIWADVRKALNEEAAAHPELWPTKESMWEVAFSALIQAVEGFCEEGESGGGYEALLSRQVA